MGSGRSERLCGQQRRALARRGEQEALNDHQSGEVADLAVELRNEDRVLVVELGGEAAQAGGVAAGERAQVPQRPHRPGGELTISAEVRGERGLVDRGWGGVPARACG